MAHRDPAPEGPDVVVGATGARGPKLPSLLILGAIFALGGYIFGATGRSSGPPATTTMASATSTTAVPMDPDATTPFVLVAAPESIVPIPAQLTVVRDRESASRVLELQIYPGFPDAQSTPLGRRLTVIGGDIVFLALDRVTVIDIELRTDPVDLGPAVHLLPGSEPGHVWAIGSGSRRVRDLDVTRRTTVGRYEMTGLGTPVASYAGGLVLVPHDPMVGRIAVWSPRRGLEAIRIARDLTFIGAGGHTLVFVGDRTVVTHNTLTGETTSAAADVRRGPQPVALVSPDGQFFAIERRRSIVDLPAIEIMDTATGASVDLVEAAFPWELQWTATGDLLYLRFANRGYQAVIRDVRAGRDVGAVGLDGSTFWMATGA